MIGQGRKHKAEKRSEMVLVNSIILFIYLYMCNVRVGMVAIQEHIAQLRQGEPHMLFVTSRTIRL